MSQAISEYAPGCHIIADGRMYTPRYISKVVRAGKVSFDDGYYCQCGDSNCRTPNFIYDDSNMQDKEVLVTINKAIMASPDLRNKKDLILAFIDSLNQNSNVYSDFEAFMNSKKKEELDKIIAEENLNSEETYIFVRRSFENGSVETTGTEIVQILPPMNMFSKDNDRQIKKNRVIDKLLEFFDKFFSISNNKI